MLISSQVMSQNGPQNLNYSIYGHTFFGHNLAIFCLIGLIFLVTQETIIYRLVMRNHDFNAFLEKFIFLWENGRGRHRDSKGSGASSPDQKFGPLGKLFGSTAISKTCF